MIPFPFPVVLFRADPGTRLEAFLKAHPAFVATLDLSINGSANVKQTLRLARPRRLRLDAKGAGLDFVVLATEATFIEIDRAGKVYDQRPSTGGIGLYDSRMSSASSFLPGFLVGGVAAAFGSAKPTVTPVAGGDEMRATVETQTGPLDLRLVVDPQGKPIRFERKGGSRTVVWRLTSFADLGADPTPFRLEPPLGYVPFALPDLPAPLQVGEAAPLTGWRKAGKPIDLAAPQRGKSRLLAVLGSDCPPSQAVRSHLASLGKSIPVFVIAPGEIVDPSGTLMKKLSPPGTPMFYLVGSDGKVKNLWFGFDPAKAAAWESEVREAAQGAGKE